MKNNRRKREYFRIQKLIGVGLLVLSAVFMSVLLTLGESDGTFLLITVPLGLWLIFTKNIVLDFGCKLEIEEGRRGRTRN